MSRVERHLVGRPMGSQFGPPGLISEMIDPCYHVGDAENKGTRANDESKPYHMYPCELPVPEPDTDCRVL